MECICPAHTRQLGEPLCACHSFSNIHSPTSHPPQPWLPFKDVIENHFRIKADDVR